MDKVQRFKFGGDGGTWIEAFVVPGSSPHLIPRRRLSQHRCVVNCVGCDIVQADHAPDGGVAQGIFHGVLVRHHGRNQEEVEEGLEKEVERQEEENAQETTKCTCMDGMR